MDIKTIPIDRIDLSVRSMNALHRAGVHTVNDMLSLDEDSLSNIRNLGKKSIEEILKKIEEYKKLDVSDRVANGTEITPVIVMPENIDDWLEDGTARNIILKFFTEKEADISIMDMLSAKAYNLLILNGYGYIYQIVLKTEDELLQIPKMDADSANRIIKCCRFLVRDNEKDILEYCDKKNKSDGDLGSYSIFDMMKIPECQDAIIKYVKKHDIDIVKMNLSSRPRNQLSKKGYKLLSDIIFMNRSEFQNMSSMGKTSVDEIVNMIDGYLYENENRILAFINGEEVEAEDDSIIEDMILSLYIKKPFYGFSFSEFKEELKLQSRMTDDKLKKIIGRMIADEKLEYVDYRCYRIYDKFKDYLSKSQMDDRSREFITKRLQGITLEAIGNEHGITRERVRQIVKRGVERICNEHTISTGVNIFDEDYYRYFYSTYYIDKEDGERWFGITPQIRNYMDMMDVKMGDEDLKNAINDDKKLDVGLRLKIKNYLNRNKLFIDGIWVEKNRSELEKAAVKKFCQNDVSFEEFSEIYNSFLESFEISYDENIYYTDAVLRTRKNHLSESRYLLWKQNERIRYYDIDARDYAELIEALNLKAYKNIELSTLKFVEENPEVLKKYDIRDQYELHNLLRKIVNDELIPDFHCGRMPVISFGTFNRDEAILELLIENAPISLNDLCEIIHKGYGYDYGVIQGTYLKAFSEYYHQGIYSIDQKVMPEGNKRILRNLLTEDFYYLDEIREIYKSAFPNADLEEINPYNLKNMGFIVMRKYAIQNYSSLERYCEHILTCDDIIDITEYRKRFVYVQAFSQRLTKLKKNLSVIEFEQNKIINIRKLEAGGITRDHIQNFCDAVYEWVDDDRYFSIKQIRSDGFESDMFDYGFSDWFYSNLLVSDERFSYGMLFGNLILYKGVKDITIKSFEMSLIKEAGVIDVYDLMNELAEVYGCNVKGKSDVVNKICDTEIFYDDILERFYANIDVFYMELDQAGDI